MGGMVGEHCVCILMAIAMLVVASHVCIYLWLTAESDRTRLRNMTFRCLLAAQVSQNGLNIITIGHKSGQRPQNKSLIAFCLSGIDISVAKVDGSLAELKSTTTWYAKQASSLNVVSAVRMSRSLPELDGTGTLNAKQTLV